jgi:hypothetical protein
VSSAMRGDTPEAHLKMLQLARRHFGTGGVQRLRFTLPPVIFSCLGLARQVVSAAAAGGAGAVVGGGGVSVKKLFQFLHQTVQVCASATSITHVRAAFMVLTLLVTHTTHVPRFRARERAKTAWATVGF